MVEEHWSEGSLRKLGERAVDRDGCGPVLVTAHLYVRSNLDNNDWTYCILGLHRISGWPGIRYMAVYPVPFVVYPDDRLEKLFKIKNSFDNLKLSIYNKRSVSRFVEKLNKGTFFWKKNSLLLFSRISGKNTCRISGQISIQFNPIYIFLSLLLLPLFLSLSFSVFWSLMIIWSIQAKSIGPLTADPVIRPETGYKKGWISLALCLSFSLFIHNIVQAITIGLTMVVLHVSILSLLLCKPQTRLLSTLISGNLPWKHLMWPWEYFLYRGNI